MRKDKRGVMGLDTGKAFLIGLLGLVVIGVVFLIILTSLGNTSVIANDNNSQAVIDNATAGATDFFSNTGTWLALLAIVVLILIIAVVVVVINRFGGKGGSL